MQVRMPVFVLLATICFTLSQVLAQAKAHKGSHQHGSAAKSAFTPDQIQYGPAPNFLPPGARLAVLEGNPMGSSENYTVRLKMPDGYKISPHWHPHRDVTVVSGTLKVGMGDKWDDSKMAEFPQGSFAYLDPSMHHYAGASGETVVQIHGVAPVKFNYINPQDDPTKQK